MEKDLKKRGSSAVARAELVEHLENEWHGTPPPKPMPKPVVAMTDKEIRAQLRELVTLIRSALPARKVGRD